MTDRRLALLRAFRHRPFVLLWSGRTLSRLGDSVYLVTLPWWIVAHHGSAGALGPLLLASDGVRGLILVVVSFLFGTVDALVFSAYRAAVRDLTPADLLTSANSLRLD